MNLKHNKPNPNTVPGFWDIDHKGIELNGDAKLFFETPNKQIQIFNNVLDESSSNKLSELFLNSNIAAPVSIHGLKDEMCGIGSVRATGWSTELAEQLTKLIIPNLSVFNATDLTATDWWQDGMHRT